MAQVARSSRAGSIINSFVSGTVHAETNSNSRCFAGGVGGYFNYGTITNSYATVNATKTGGVNISNATGKTTAEMKHGDFVTLLNSNAEPHKEWMSNTPGLNDGYPIHELYAKWQFMSPYLDGISLSADSLSRAFSKNVYKYKITLGENDSAITLTPIREYEGANMTINGRAITSTTLNTGIAQYSVTIPENKATIQITAKAADRLS